jgi:uncharacterized membrane protein SpoIIM required for sporulation
MSPLEFEQVHAAEWEALETQLGLLEARKPGVDAAAVLRSHRRVCEQLALAQARGYPLHVAERLGALAQRAHRLIYREPPAGVARLSQFLRLRFPQGLRRQRGPMLWATLAFALPLLATGLACWHDPAFALLVLPAENLSSFDAMYGDAAHAIGRTRGADDDWQMFGHYIRNNIGIAFQCFATGLLAGLGSLFFLVVNGVMIGAVAGYLTARGLGHNFWPFVATHGAFELTAIVIAGAAGLMLGRALLAPGTLTRGGALAAGGREAATLVGGAAAMLVVAAAVEAFWSPARWVPPAVKFGVAALCWALVFAYLARAGRGVAEGES